MSISGGTLQQGVLEGTKNAMATKTVANDAKANVDNVSIFLQCIKKAEESAQAAF